MRTNEETRIKRAHITLMQHPNTALYSGVISSGKNEVVDAKTEGMEFTAYTDGINKVYCREYVATYKSESKLRGLVLHENLHVGLKQIPRHRDLSHDHKLLNYAMDFVVNDIIHNTGGVVGVNKEPLVLLPDGALYNSMFHDWSVRKVYDYLKKRKQELDEEGDEKGKGSGGNKTSSSGEPQDGETDVDDALRNMGDSMDEHIFTDVQEMSAEELKKMEGEIDKALRQGGMLAGRCCSR